MFWNLIVFFLTFVCVFVSFIYLLYKHQFRFWSKYGIKHSIPTIPYGDMASLGDISIGELITNIYNKYPDDRYIGLWFYAKPLLLVRDPELIKLLFVKHFSNFHDRGVELNERDDPLSAHLFSISGSKWRNTRIKMTPTFTSGKMKMMFPILVECCQHLITALDEQIEKGQVIDLKEYSARFTTDIISSCAFGIESNSLKNPDSEFRTYGKKIFAPTISLMFNIYFMALLPTLARFCRISQTPKDVTKFFLKALKDNIEYRKQNKIRRKDFLDLLIQLMEKGSIEDADNEESAKVDHKFSFEEAAAEAFVFFVAGFETSSTAMQFCLYELALNSDIQRKAREEIQSALKRHNGELSYDCLNEMDYLTCIIDETLRKYPPVPRLHRSCNNDYKIPDTNEIIPKGVMVEICVLALHRDPKYYPNPEQFDPNRFTAQEKEKRHHYAYLPFGEGPRNCIGMRFGLMQMKIGLATIIKNYEIAIGRDTKVPLVLDPKSFLVTPDGPMNLDLKKIESVI